MHLFGSVGLLLAWSVSTFMGIAIHNLSASGEIGAAATDLSAALRQTAAGLLGTTVQLADLVRPDIHAWQTCDLMYERAPQVIPFVAGGFMYIGAVAVLPTYVLSSLDWRRAPGSHRTSFLAGCSKRARAGSRRCAR